jgi:hypothetical protein
VLYAQLADYLLVLAEKESTEVRIASGGRQHSIEIERSRIVDAAMSAYDSVVSLLKNHENHDGTTLLLSHRAAALPGLVDHLNEHTEFKVVVLHSAAAASGALAHADRIRSPESSVRFITRLPGLDARPPGPVTIPVRPPPDGGRHLPTHLVVNGVAHRIDSDPLMLGPSGVEDSAEVHHGSASVRRLAGQAVLDAPAEAGAILNGDPIEGRAALAPGDRLRFGEADSEVLVVAMAE